jgi:5-methyltetrahydrofolate--homocysteine methyltransferase
MNRLEFTRLVRQRPLVIAADALSVADKPCPATALLQEFAPVAAGLRGYKEAGCALVCCPSAAANRFRLAAAGCGDETATINRELMRRCREGMGDLPVFATCAPTGRQIEPFGSLDFDDAVACYAEQARALVEGGAQGFFVAGMREIQEARAALIALRERGDDLAVIVEIVIDGAGRMAGGTDPLSAVVTLQSLGADAVGLHCADNAVDLAALIAHVKPSATVPLYARPTTPDDAKQYAATVAACVEAGANLIGVDSSATSGQVAALAHRLRELAQPTVAKSTISALSSSRSTAFLGPEHPFAVVGERINPTGKKALQQSLRDGSLDLVRQFAAEQEQRHATVLDVNMGLSGIDEMAMMLNAVGVLSQLTPLPLCIDTTRPEVVEAALRRYPGRALVNSVSGERERIEQTLPTAAKYGAMFIVLPLTDAGIPPTVKERIAVIDTVMTAAASHGCTVDDIAVDGLVMTISSNPEAARQTLDLISWCSETLRANTIVGLSNVSFGMPERPWINGAFLGMAMGRGLTMAIANPASDRIMATVQAYNALWGHDPGMLLRRGAFSGGPS